MMTIVVVHLVLLTAAVLVLFAMMGELASRATERERPATTHPIEEAHLGQPAGFGTGPGLVVVLSTTCGACEGLAAEATRFFGRSTLDLKGMLISSASEGTARDFVARHGLGALPVSVDVAGKRSQADLGVAISPAAIAVDEAGVIRSAVAFTAYESLQPWLDQALRHNGVKA